MSSSMIPDGSPSVDLCANECLVALVSWRFPGNFGSPHYGDFQSGLFYFIDSFRLKEMFSTNPELYQ